MLTNAFPRLLGALALIWCARLAWWAMFRPVTAVWAVLAVLWLLAGTTLLRRREVRVAAATVAALSLVEMLLPLAPNFSPLVLTFWYGLILTVTDRPDERAFLVRVCVTCAYVFAAAVKLNPTWLDASQLTALARAQSHLHWLQPVLDSPAGVGLAWVAVGVEAGLAVGLWWRRTRHLTAAIGILWHTMLVVAAAIGVDSVLYLAVLNFGLVAGYVAFWHPLEMNDVRRTPHPSLATSADPGDPPPENTEHV